MQDALYICCSDAQMCRLHLQRHYDANVVLEVISSRPITSTARPYQVVNSHRRSA